jgi:hypothetical protein
MLLALPGRARVARVQPARRRRLAFGDRQGQASRHRLRPRSRRNRMPCAHVGERERRELCQGLANAMPLPPVRRQNLRR